MSAPNGAGSQQLAAKRDAVRLLFLIQKAGQPPTTGAPPGAVREVRAEKRLQALDFWLRNPDYLAHEYLERFEASGSREDLETAQSIMAGDEPELHRLSMLRFWFGAWEAVDDAIATLDMLGLVTLALHLSPDRSKIKERRYYLTELGEQKATALAASPPFDWYSARAELVALVAGGETGNELKNRQHAVATYHDAKHGTLIESIQREVLARLARHGRRAV